MSKTMFNIYLAGEVHSDWREKIREGATAADLPLRFFAPITDHDASDSVGVNILGAEEKPRSEERRVGKECRSRWSP